MPDAVVISNHSARLAHAVTQLAPYFRLTIFPPFADAAAIAEYAARYQRPADAAAGYPHKQISLTLGHLYIWRAAAQYTANPYLYIFEDDAEFTQDVACTLRELESTGARVLYLGTCGRKPHGTRFHNASACSAPIAPCSSLCLHAYAVHTRTAPALADEVLAWAHSRALHGHPLYRYNLDVKLRGFADATRPGFACTDVARQSAMFNSTSGHSKTCCQW